VIGVVGLILLLAAGATVTTADEDGEASGDGEVAALPVGVAEVLFSAEVSPTLLPPPGLASPPLPVLHAASAAHARLAARRRAAPRVLVVRLAIQPSTSQHYVGVDSA